MCKVFIPYAVAENIYEIDLAFFLKHNVKTLLIDLDNTLDSFRLYKPLDHAVKFKETLEKNHIQMIIISNNKGKRVSSYANALGVPYLNSAHKPFSRRLKNLIKERNLNLEETMFVGDQMMTDVVAANHAGLRIVLCNKLVKEDQWTTHINRIFGRRIRKYLAKHNKLVSWKER